MEHVLEEAQHLVRAGNANAARLVLEGAIAKSRHDIRLLRALGRVYLLCGQPLNAARVLQAALSLVQARQLLATQPSNDEDVTDDDLNYIEDRAAQVGSEPTLQTYFTRSHRAHETSAPVPIAAQAEAASRELSPDFVLARPDLIASEPDNLGDETAQSRVSKIEPLLEAAQAEFDPPLPNEDDLVDPIADHELDELPLLPEVPDTADDDGTAEIFAVEMFNGSSIGVEEDGDWHGGKFDPYVLDLEDVLREPVDRKPDLPPGGITRERRARQIALHFINKWEWPRSTFCLLTDFFVTHGWSAARVALEREVQYGLNPDELRVSMHLRELWVGSDRYWTAFSGRESASATYRVLSWRMSVLICRSFHGCPEPEEAELFVDTEFERWYWNDYLRRQFTAFIKYLYYRVIGGAQMLPADCVEDFGQPHHEDWDDVSDLGLTDLSGSERELLLLQQGFRICEGPREYLRSVYREREVGETLEPPHEREDDDLFAMRVLNKAPLTLNPDSEAKAQPYASRMYSTNKSKPAESDDYTTFSLENEEISDSENSDRPQYPCLNCSGMNPLTRRICLHCGRLTNSLKSGRLGKGQRHFQR